MNPRGRASSRVALRLILFLASALGASAFAAEPTRAPREPMRPLAQEATHTLRALYLEDPRLPKLSPAQRTELYGKLERLTAEWFGYRIKVQDVGARRIEDFFAQHQDAFKKHAAFIAALSFSPDPAIFERQLLTVIARDFRARSLLQLRRYLHNDALSTQAEAVEFAKERFLERLTEWQALPTEDGQPLLRPGFALHHSYAHWSALQKEVTDADLIFTNSMIVGPDTAMPLYVIARGGITTGNTDNNDRNPYQVTMVLGCLPMLSDAPALLRERGPIPERERLDVIATMTLHELGHFLLRYAEHYEHPGCVHMAPEGLNYYAWHQAVRKKGPCPLPHTKRARFDD